MSTPVLLSTLVDVAFGTPQVGAVNFNALHSLLHALLNHLNIQNLKIKVDFLDEKNVTAKSDVDASDPLSKMESARYKTMRAPFHCLERRVESLARALQKIIALPTKEELFKNSKSKVECNRPLSDVWQTMQIKKRVEANEDGIKKLMSMIQDLMYEMQLFKDHTNVIDDLQNDLEDVKANTPENLNSFVTWSGLQEAFCGKIPSTPNSRTTARKAQSFSEMESFMRSSESSSGSESSTLIHDITPPSTPLSKSMSGRSSPSSPSTGSASSSISHLGQALPSSLLKQEQLPSSALGMVSTPSPSSVQATAPSLSSGLVLAQESTQQSSSSPSSDPAYPSIKSSDATSAYIQLSDQTSAFCPSSQQASESSPCLRQTPSQAPGQRHVSSPFLTKISKSPTALAKVDSQLSSDTFAPSKQPGSNSSAPSKQPGSDSSAPSKQPGSDSSAPSKQPGLKSSAPSKQPGSDSSAPSKQAHFEDSAPSKQAPSESLRPSYQHHSDNSTPSKQARTDSGPTNKVLDLLHMLGMLHEAQFDIRLYDLEKQIKNKVDRQQLEKLMKLNRLKCDFSKSKSGKSKTILPPISGTVCDENTDTDKLNIRNTLAFQNVMDGLDSLENKVNKLYINLSTHGIVPIEGDDDEMQTTSLGQKKMGLLEQQQLLKEQFLELGIRIDEQISSLNKKVSELDNMKKILMSMDHTTIKRIQDEIDQIQDHIKKLQNTTQNIIDDSSRKTQELQDLLNNEMEIDVKAGKELLEKRTNEMNMMINEILDKLTENEDSQKSLANNIDGKLDRMELPLLKKWVEERLKELLKKFNLGEVEDDTAAGLRRQLAMKFHCLSCDRSVDILPTGVTYQGMPPRKTVHAHPPYELELMQKHDKSFTMAELASCYETIRQAGGPNTTTFLRLLSSAGLIPYKLKEGVEVQGVNGQIYKGSKNVKLEANIPTSLTPSQHENLPSHPPILTVHQTVSATNGQRNNKTQSTLPATGEPSPNPVSGSHITPDFSSCHGSAQQNSPTQSNNQDRHN